MQNLYEKPFTTNDILKQVSNIQIHKSSGFPLIASKIWKIVFKEFAPLLCYIFNPPIISGKFPPQWEIGTVIPIPEVSNPKVI